MWTVILNANLVIRSMECYMLDIIYTNIYNTYSHTCTYNCTNRKHSCLCAVRYNVKRVSDLVKQDLGSYLYWKKNHFSSTLMMFILNWKLQANFEKGEGWVFLRNAIWKGTREHVSVCPLLSEAQTVTPTIPFHRTPACILPSLRWDLAS